MKSGFSLLILAAVVFPGFTALTPEKTVQPHPVAPFVTLTGAHSQIQKTEYSLISNQKEMINAWQRHLGASTMGGYSMHYNKLGVPQVDFEKCRVLAIFQGQTVNSAGLKAVSMTEAKNRVVFRFDDNSFQTMGGAQSVTPYAFFVIPKIMKEILVEENVQGTIGAPPIWKTRILFNQTVKSTVSRPNPK